MNENSIKHLLKIGVYKKYIESSVDLSLQRFYMAGENLIRQDQIKELSSVLLPIIMYEPAKYDAEMDDYWSVAICMGPIDDDAKWIGITTLPFSYRPWELRMNNVVSYKEQFYTLAIIINKFDYHFPAELLKIIFIFLVTSKGYNNGFIIRDEPNNFWNDR